MLACIWYSSFVVVISFSFAMFTETRKFLCRAGSCSVATEDVKKSILDGNGGVGAGFRV